MTLCIAATCQENREPRIVLCCDAMAGTDASSSETALKRVLLPPSAFVGLYSGTISESYEVLSRYRQQLGSFDPLEYLPLHELMEHLRAPLRNHRDAKRNDLVRRLLGLTYDEFLVRGNQVDSLKRTKVEDEIGRLVVDVDLLISGFMPDSRSQPQALIFSTVSENLQHDKNFACIGTGSEVAEQSLRRREQTFDFPLDLTLYQVYEAKRMSEIAPNVGKATRLGVMKPSTGADAPYRLNELTQDAEEFLEQCYRRYGLQEIDEHFTFPEMRRYFPVRES